MGATGQRLGFARTDARPFLRGSGRSVSARMMELDSLAGEKKKIREDVVQ